MKISLLLDGEPPRPHAGVVKVRYSERIGELWRAVVWVINLGRELEPKGWVGHNLTLRIGDSRGRVVERLDGVVVGFGAQRSDPGWGIYRVELRPVVWKLRLRVRSQVFSSVSVKDVVERLLRDGGFSAGRHYSFKLSGSYAVREQVVQYAMSDWEFARGLMLASGMVCFFHSPSPGADPEQMVITDDRSFFPVVSPDPPFAPGSGMPAGMWAVRGFFAGGQVVPSKVSLSRLDPTKVHTLYTASRSLGPGGEGEVALFMGSGQPKGLEHEVKVGIQELDKLGRWARVDSTDPLLRAGRVFSMDPHPQGGSGRFLVVQAAHYMHQQPEYGLSGSEWELSYEGRALVVPSRVEWRGGWIGAWAGLLDTQVEGAGYGL